MFRIWQVMYHFQSIPLLTNKYVLISGMIFYYIEADITCGLTDFAQA